MKAPVGPARMPGNAKPKAKGTSLRPVPPGPGKSEGTRYFDIHEGELDEVQMATWVKQAAALPGVVPWS